MNIGIHNWAIITLWKKLGKVFKFPTSNGEDLTDVDPEEAETACANKTQSLQVQQGRCVLETLEPTQLFYTQHQGGPAPVKDTQQGLKTLLKSEKGWQS